jgi:hypothetical protein
MKKLMILLTIRFVVRNTDEAIKIYNALFSAQNNNVKNDVVGITGTTKPIVQIKKPTTKKDELLESLGYLKSKKIKTKQDKDSIGVLEAVLKNMV